MIIFSLISSLLIILAIVLLLGLTPEKITEDILRIISPKQSLRDCVKLAQGKKKPNKISVELKHIQDTLAATDKGGQFAVICALSLCLLISGGIFAVMINNLFLIPVFSITLAIIPFIYAKGTIAYYEKHIQEEMETALSIITTSYVRSNDIVGAVEENLSYLKPPIREIFKSFLGESTVISSDIKKALFHLKEKIDNQIYREWCDTLISCQDDRTLKTTLLSVVNKLTDVRVVNNELKTMLYEPRKEYFMMAALVVGNIPLLYMINKDWYHLLMGTLPGKIVLAITGAVVLITAGLMMKYTKPVEYKR